ncbi:MAG TPA: hypothetical protein EYG11_06955 [Candidatus Latescibacteria bacterium]|nr:hypothetical protein [Candidatus Handelsmanbacteria bacterium]HIL08424.1 hypothetical protein [Candidatus Latescibacterota bacterium]
MSIESAQDLKAVEREAQRHHLTVIPELMGHGIGRVIHDDHDVRRYSATPYRDTVRIPRVHLAHYPQHALHRQPRFSPAGTAGSEKKTRPRTQREDSSRPFYASKTTARQYYGDLLATTDGTAIYNEVHRLYTDLQQDVTRRHDNAHTCDLSAFIEQLEQRQLDGQLNPHIKIFREDACHLYEFAEQQMAEFVALTIAPQHRDRIERHIASFTYNARTAHQLLTEEQPGGALVLREQSGRRSGSCTATGRSQKTSGEDHRLRRTLSPGTPWDRRQFLRKTHQTEDLSRNAAQRFRRCLAGLQALHIREPGER